MVTMQMWLAAAILLGAYLLIFTAIMHRTSAGVIGAVVMVAAGTSFGFYSPTRFKDKPLLKVAQRSLRHCFAAIPFTQPFPG